MGTSLQQTPLPVDQSQTIGRAPSSAAPNDTSNDAELDNDVPVSTDGRPSAAPSSTAAATIAPQKKPAASSPKRSATKPHVQRAAVTAKKRPVRTATKKARPHGCSIAAAKATANHAKSCK